MSRLRLPILLLAACALIAGCGGGGDGGGGARNPIEQVPAGGGLRERVQAAQDVTPADFPAPAGRSLARLANQIGARAPAQFATSVFVAGRRNRLAFGTIDQGGRFVYGKSAVYVARTPQSPARGPYPAPADLLVTEPAFRSRQAATASDPFAAVYAAEVPFGRAGRYYVLTATRSGQRDIVGAMGQLRVISAREDPIPDVGERAPRVHTDTLAGAGGNAARIDTRVPPSDMHKVDFADVLGRKPVALLFATPQLCQSRVCGPVVDVALQVRERFGKRVEFIHQEVYTDNDPRKGLREPLQRFHLRTEPWLFVVGGDGRITARLEGSFGLRAMQDAVASAL